jgi:3-oxoadipate enol-lactonase
MPEIETNGIRVHYELSGQEDRPVVMLSNSLGTNHAMWDAQMPELSGRWRVLRYDTRGHGRSAAPEGHYTIEQLALDAIGLLDALAIERVHFCGLSMGGMIGQVLGARHGERLLSLALCATACHMPQRDIWDGRIRTAREQGMAPLADGVVERWFTEAFRAEPRPEVERVREMILATPPHGYAGCCAAIRDMDLRDLIQDIEVRTLIIAGKKDPATPVEAARAIEERVRGSSLTVIPEAAHLVNIEQTSAFNRALASFLGRA